MLLSADMPMIAFSGFIIVSQHTDIIDDIGQCIFEIVIRSRHWFWHPPKAQFGKRVFGYLITLIEQQNRLHVGADTIMAPRCQLLQHRAIARSRDTQ
jgi:hypothetical protein